MTDGPAPGGHGPAHAALVLAAALFGVTFYLVKDAIDEVGPVPFVAARFLVGAAALWPFARRGPAQPGLLRAGAWCGAALVAGYVLQTVGLQYTSEPVSAFITYLLVVMVPLLSAAVLRRPPGRPVLAGVVLATAGLWLLTGARLAVGRGELLTLGCALAFAAHIVLLAELAPRFDSLRLNVVQLAVVGAGCLGPGLVTGGYAFPAEAWVAVVLCGVGASAGAMLLQVWAQRQVGPTRTALLLTLEPVFAAAFGYVAGRSLGGLALAGAGLILLGVLVAELAPAPGPAPPSGRRPGTPRYHPGRR